MVLLSCPGIDSTYQTVTASKRFTNLSLFRSLRCPPVGSRAGWYLWSLLDNVEWALGHGRRLGIVHIGYDTLTRTPKDSYHWYRGLITAHRARTEETTP